MGVEFPSNKDECHQTMTMCYQVLITKTNSHQKIIGWPCLQVLRCMPYVYLCMQQLYINGPHNDSDTLQFLAHYRQLTCAIKSNYEVEHLGTCQLSEITSLGLVYIAHQAYTLLWYSTYLNALTKLVICADDCKDFLCTLVYSEYFNYRLKLIMILTTLSWSKWNILIEWERLSLGLALAVQVLLATPNLVILLDCMAYFMHE